MAPSIGGAYSAPGLPLQLPSPRPVGSDGSGVPEGAGRSAPGDGVRIEKPTGAIQSIPQNPAVLDQKLPLLNGPDNPLGPASGFPDQPPLVPLPRSNSGLEVPGTEKPNPGDRTT
ncbi:MAG: hypothetical protein NZ602_01735 [Thermoguttaceae bacterium]|nr:hypothetical protein [Thermoguttaceae bacterium]MDW8038827.1 hypothetical protein [Thermoguttaceae bacterium]